LIRERRRSIVRGTIGGKGNVITDAATHASPSVQPAFEIGQSGSHTLQSRDFEDPETLRARLIEAIVKAIADGSGPRLAQSRLSL
jgi:hypothetical protein